MRKTLFAGLTVLEPGEGLDTDNGAFIARDRDTIDRLLQIGAKLHRHSGLPGLSNPLQTPSGSVTPSGGTIRPDLAITLGYTIEDGNLGETELSPLVTLVTPPALSIPLVAPVAEIDYSAGDLLVDTYYYGLTYIDSEGGETPIGATTPVDRDPGYDNAQVLLSGLSAGMAGASAVGWRLYRAIGGGTYDYLTAGTGDTFTDDGSVAVNCDIHPPLDTENTTNAINTLFVKLPSADAQVGSASFINLYGTLSGSFGEASHLGRYPISSAGVLTSFTSLEFNDASPPDRNLSIGGASQIDPDSELIDWHWKRPVANHAALGSGQLGDVRLNLATGNFELMLVSPSGGNSQWTTFTYGGPSGVNIEDEGNPVHGSALGLDFVGPGVTVTDNGDGTVTVTIPGGGGGGGMGASALIDVSDADGPVLGDRGYIEFLASGGASVGVTDLGNGSARVTIFAQTGGGTGNPTDFRDAEGTSIIDAAQLEFRGSGGIGVDLIDLGGGSGRVLIGPDPSAAIVAPMAPSALLDVTDADGPNIPDIGQLKFQASGGTSVGVTDLGGGSAQVTMFSPSAASIAIEAWHNVGDPGEIAFGSAWGNTASGFSNAAYRKEGDLVRMRGAVVKGAANGTPVEGETIFTLPVGYRPPARIIGQGMGGRVDINTDGTVIFVGGEAWQGLDGIVFSTISAGGGEIIGSFAPLSRRWASAFITLSSGASGNVDFTGSAAGARLIRVATNKRARVRMYGDDPARTADLSRAIGTDPSGDHGVLLDFANTAQASGAISRVAPHVDAHNLDSPIVLNKHYLNVTNYDATGGVVVAFLYIPTEVV